MSNLKKAKDGTHTWGPGVAVETFYGTGPSILAVAKALLKRAAGDETSLTLTVGFNLAGLEEEGENSAFDGSITLEA